jgi:hypothetical protein
MACAGTTQVRLMSSISLLGQMVTTEFIGTFNESSNSQNVALSAKTNALQKRDPAVPAHVEWRISSAGGPRGVYVQYSSAHELPCELLINGELVQKKALFESTHGLKLIDWRYQCTVDLPRGESVITIRASGAMPHIRSVAIGEPPVRSHSSVDDYFQLLSDERSSEAPKETLKVQPKSLSGLVEVASRVAGDDTAIRKLGQIADLAVRAVQDHVMNGQASIPWGGPLNGQRYRQFVFERLMRSGCDAIVETGTYLGTSTAFFARHRLPVHSCELREEYFAAALSQLTPFDNVTLYLSDSRRFLTELAADRRSDYQRPFFYLDAHWYDDLPLSDEIRIIQQRWREHIIMVDDFCVPEAGYSFDRYPNGLELTLDHLQKQGVDLSATAILFPTATHAAETSARRGTLVLMPLSLYERQFAGERSLFRFVPDEGSKEQALRAKA